MLQAITVIDRPCALPPCRELKIKLEEDRKRLVEAINTTFGNLVRRGWVGAGAVVPAGAARCASGCCNGQRGRRAVAVLRRCSGGPEHPARAHRHPPPPQGTAAVNLLTDRDKLLTAVGGLSLLALGVYSGGWVGGWVGAGVAWGACMGEASPPIWRSGTSSCCSRRILPPLLVRRAPAQHAATATSPLPRSARGHALRGQGL